MNIRNRRLRQTPRHRPSLLAGAVALASTILIAGNTVASAASTPEQRLRQLRKPAASMPMTTMVDGVSIAEDTALAATVPAAVKKSGLLDITYNDFAPDEYVRNGQLVGWEVDLGHAVAATLGVAWKPTSSASFDTFVPSLQNGRFNSSFTSFIVTSARTKVIDIVSLYNVGTGFAAKVGKLGEAGEQQRRPVRRHRGRDRRFGLHRPAQRSRPGVQERRQTNHKRPDLPV